MLADEAVYIASESSFQRIHGISRLSDIHNRVFAALNLKKPSQPQQLFLL